jgi:hypothetical protein
MAGAGTRALAWGLDERAHRVCGRARRLAIRKAGLTWGSVELNMTQQQTDQIDLMLQIQGT